MRYQHSTVASPASATAAQAAAVGHIYVTNQLDDTLSVINARTNQVTATVPAGVGARRRRGHPGRQPRLHRRLRVSASIGA